MQTLSNMRRNSSNLRYLGNFLGIIALFAYEVATTMYSVLPPLIGVFFTYLIFEYSKKRKRYTEFDFGWYLSIAFLIFAEQIHGFYIFSSIVAFFIFFYFMVDWLFATFKSRLLLLAVFVSAGYVGTYAVSSLMSYIQNSTMLYFGSEYLVFISVEFLISIVLFKERIV